MQSSIRYRGYVYDYETGLYYLQSRYYDPEVSRFLNADAVDYIGYSGEQLSYNAFAYCVNNPTNKVDSTGTLSTFVIVCIIGGALIGGGIGGYVAWKHCKLKKNKGLWVLGGILMGAVAGAAIGAVVGMVGKTVIAKLAAIGPKVTTKTGFASFSKLKSAIGRAGDGRAWHHIVEQCQAKSTRSGFDVKDINTATNVKATPKEVHKEISRYYSSKQKFTNGKTVRDWLNGQNFDKQFELGLEKWEEFMTQFGYPIK